jgi:hypothetical protein
MRQQSDDVIVHVDDNEPAEDVIAELKLNWMQMPDAIPCDIAAIGDDSYTCRQVLNPTILIFTCADSSQAYLMRCEMFPDSERPESEEDTDEETKKSGKKKAAGMFL